MSRKQQSQVSYRHDRQTALYNRLVFVPALRAGKLSTPYMHA